MDRWINGAVGGRIHIPGSQELWGGAVCAPPQSPALATPPAPPHLHLLDPGGPGVETEEVHPLEQRGVVGGPPLKRHKDGLAVGLRPGVMGGAAARQGAGAAWAACTLTGVGVGGACCPDPGRPPADPPPLTPLLLPPPVRTRGRGMLAPRCQVPRVACGMRTGPPASSRTRGISPALAQAQAKTLTSALQTGALQTGATHPPGTAQLR